MTADQLRAPGRQRKSAYDQARRAGAPPKPKKEKKPKGPVLPPWKPLRSGDMDFDVDAQVPEDRGLKTQRVFLQPMSQQKLQEAMIRVNAVVGLVRNAAIISPELFRRDIEELLAFVVQPGKRHYDRDFAKEARKALEAIEEKLAQATLQLEMLRDLMRVRVE